MPGVDGRPGRADAGAARPAGRRRRPGRSALFLVGALVVVLGVAAALLVPRAADGPDVGAPDPSPSPTASAVPAAEAREAALQELLDRRAAAVLAGDVAGVVGTADPAAPDFRARQEATATGLARVPLERWSYEVRGEGAPLGAGRLAELGPDAWVADVLLSYRVAGVDPVDQQREQSLTVVRRDGAWLLTADDDGPTRADLWDLGVVDVVQTERTVVVGTAPRAVLEEQGALGDVAARRVDAVWGTSWPRRTVLVVPADEQQLARVLGRDGTAGLDQLAALTVGAERGSGAAGAEGAVDRVLVNPSGLARLEERGRTVVLTHETTHVAVRAGAAADPPLWLSEGFADLVGYAPGEGEEALPPEAVAADLLDAVRRDGPPASLPAPEAFDATRGDVAPAYGAAYLAARTVEQRYGRPALLELVRATTGRAPAEVAGEVVPGAAPVPPEQAVPQVLGVDLAVLEQQWRDDVVALAGTA
ncbi:hypothetical protein EDC03_0311 [Pseudokineococcus lusitanus]|uniref:Peptidase MA superfamily protein n=1 Tax=Pseudokineococcus lusitanus TaxID=763993 RepID=A0A3N1HTI1_9ACTN|nr:hypothetical protein EDC03_0311 [Pseudokineococcus lusitanus]